MNTIDQTVHIITAQLGAQPMSTEAICASVKAIHATLASLENKPQALPAPSDSIQQNKVICLECGAEFKLLSNKHLAMHDLTPRKYKIKHGLPLTKPLSSRALTQKRRAIAKASSAGQALTTWHAARQQSA